MPKAFFPPVYYSTFEDINTPRLFEFFTHGMAYGLSVLKYGDTDYRIIDSPMWEEMHAAVRTYLGGRTYVVDDAEAALLSAAGYDAYLVEIDLYADGFDEGYPDETPTEFPPGSPPLDQEVNTDTPSVPTSGPSDVDLGGFGAGGFGGGGFGT